MGLLSRLWNLNTRGCSLQEPLKSMIESKKYKTMDIIGYLKSVLEDARPYARMKLMIVGVQGIGKTSLLEQLRQEGRSRQKPVEVFRKFNIYTNVNNVMYIYCCRECAALGQTNGQQKHKCKNIAGHEYVDSRRWHRRLDLREENPEPFHPWPRCIPNMGFWWTKRVIIPSFI